MSLARRGLHLGALATSIGLASVTGVAHAADPASASAEAPADMMVERVALRFYAPETGGPARPRFVSDRLLAFEARLEALTEDGSSQGYDDRHLRAGMERHISEELLASLPLEHQPDEAEISRIAAQVRAGLAQRVGGEAALMAAANEGGIAPEEVNALLRRRARAAIYLERTATSFLFPTDEQLREVFRTAPHPFRGQKYDAVRGPLSEWYVDERLHLLEGAFLQAARTRVKILPSPRPS